MHFSSQTLELDWSSIWLIQLCLNSWPYKPSSHSSTMGCFGHWLARFHLVDYGGVRHGPSPFILGKVGHPCYSWATLWSLAIWFYPFHYGCLAHDVSIVRSPFITLVSFLGWYIPNWYSGLAPWLDLSSQCQEFYKYFYVTGPLLHVMLIEVLAMPEVVSALREFNGKFETSSVILLFCVTNDLMIFHRKTLTWCWPL